MAAVHESSAGLGSARNAGIASSKGRTVAFTDDDCYLEQDYFAAVPEAFDDGTLDYLGGRILLYDKADALYAVCYRDERILIPPQSFVS